MKRFFFITVFTAGFQLALNAQFDTQISNYWALINYFNPAYAGHSDKLEAAYLNRMQWLGIEGAPRTSILTAQMPYKFMERIHGLGVSMYNDRSGLYSISVVSGQYAWKKKMLKGDFSIGLQAGYANISFDGSKVVIPQDDYHQQTDPAIPTSKVDGKSIDASLGMFFFRPKWYAGLSVTHLLAPEIVLGEQYVFDIPRTYYFTAGYNIPLSNPLLELRPSILLKTMEMSSVYIDEDSLVTKVETNTFKAMLRNTQLDVSARIVYDDKFWGGLGWRKQDALTVMLGGKFKMIEAGYAYDFPISGIRKESSGSHEIFIRYSMDLNMNKGVKGKHKSVRIL
ncbi:MAG: type IX secretion system membrane protein PorP/SprF [Dysgonamonadaceae bacterium]|jgi:type IX secretion system PorP/SprF family membrane protein|nr:type IX secretion system membrane protein PorP/SprF [Dysgonamonadaceae bacterium]